MSHTWYLPHMDNLPTSWPKLQKLLARENCAFYASEMLRGPPEFNGRFFAGAHHEEWAELLNAHKRLCVIAPRGHGKCMTGDALILRADGALVRHDAWRGGDVLAWSGTGFVVRHATAAESQGLRDCLRIRTRTGRDMTVTTNHPLLLASGWRNADQLVVGDAIAVAKKIGVFGTGEVQSPWLLGLLVGDGTFNNGCSVQVTTADAAVVLAVQREATTRGWCVVQRSQYTYALSTRQGIKRGTAKHWIRDLELMGARAREKHVPDCIMTAAPEVICDFLAGYLDSDGCVSLHGGGSVEFYSVSERLMRQVQHLLARFGIVSTLAPKKGKYNGADHWSWRLAIRGAYVLRLARVIRPRGARLEQLRDLVRHLEPRVRRHDDTEVLWDEIVDIEAVGLHETFAVHVPGPENYVANDVVQHNSFFYTFAYPLWMAERNPDRSGFIFSASQPQAEEILIRIMREIDGNPKLSHLRPKQMRRWSAKSLELSNGFTLHARGYGTKVRGAHPIFICLDDILNDETAFSETVRTKQIDYFFSAVTNMLEPNGQIVCVGTPLHANDLYGVMRKTPGYVVREYPAIKADGTALWPERFPIHELERIRDEIKTLRFAREFMCSAVTDLSSLFPITLFKGDKVEQFAVRLGAPGAWWEERGIQRYIGVDFALTANSGSDYTVIFVLGLDAAGNRWIVDIIRERGLSYGEQKSRIVDAARRYKPELILVESNQAQRIFGEELIRDTDLPIRHHMTTSEKHSLDRGVPGLRMLLENGKIRIPRGDERSIELTDKWIDEMRGHTIVSGRVISVAEHDDTVMAFWIADQAVRAGGMSMSFGEEEGDSAAYDEFMRETMTTDPDDEWSDHIPGAVPRKGRPPIYNARPVDADEIDEDEDNPMNYDSKPKRPGARPSAQPKDWRPKDAAPTAAQILGYSWRRR